MTDEGNRYVALAAELKVIGHPRYAELVGEMDRIWWSLSEAEHEEIEKRLIAIDEAAQAAKKGLDKNP